ncbi:hypothetical protein Pla123a_07620 [Posidoniimonas polymericola]|uniref:PEP-CTERM protein-sorting domain-containing protein n=1 Tax=Posidoniimonas polymericola TaxID=2528002 RepID=A0A5C5ZFT0_9BACT|nr:hypothetical protein [Posidoniimonas polymericola]TWT85955.1 hypothetical protein Pla123a_07620 [Posidoniimonas polymericola]
MSPSLLKTVCVAAAAALLTAHAATAQNPLGSRIDWIGDPGVEEAWDQGDSGAGEGSNWADVGFGNLQPSGEFDEYASISLQGGAGRAVIDHTISTAPTDILLGQDAGSTGTLIFRDGGSISLQPNGSVGNGELVVGAGGTGNLGLEDDMGAVNLRKYTQGNGGVLVARLGTASGFANHVVATNGIALDGRLIVEELAGSGFQLSAGDSWTLISGSAVTGGFDQITVEPELLGNPGQTIDISTSGNQVDLAVGQRLVLEVDRYTGGAVIKNWEGHSTDIEIIDYTLSSTAGNLDSSDGRWNSLADDAGKPGWAEANPSTTALSELNDTSVSLVFASGDSHDFGTPFNVNTAAPFGTQRLDTGGVTFEYLDPDTGAVQTAAIRTVGRYNDLVLAVDPVTGNATIQNQSGESLDFISYTISSASGSLLPTFAGIEGGAGPDWYDANSTTENLSELTDGTAATMAPLAMFDLGAAWDAVTGEQDLTFVYQNPITGLLTRGTVYYGDAITVSALPGDYNGDGAVNAADYALWRENDGGDGSAFAPNTRGAGLTGPIGAADYDFWKANYGRTFASSSGVASAAQTPEPAAWLLIMLGGLAVGAARSGVAGRR